MSYVMSYGLKIGNKIFDEFKSPIKNNYGVMGGGYEIDFSKIAIVKNKKLLNFQSYHGRIFDTVKTNHYLILDENTILATHLFEQTHTVKIFFKGNVVELDNNFSFNELYGIKINNTTIGTNSIVFKQDSVVSLKNLKYGTAVNLYDLMHYAINIAFSDYYQYYFSLTYNTNNTFKISSYRELNTPLQVYKFM